MAARNVAIGLGGVAAVAAAYVCFAEESPEDKKQPQAVRIQKKLSEGAVKVAMAAEPLVIHSCLRTARASRTRQRHRQKHLSHFAARAPCTLTPHAPLDPP